MKKALMLLLCLFSIVVLSALVLIDEDFSGAALPNDWSGYCPISDHNWEFSNTDNAGGTAPELKLHWQPAVEGAQYFMSPEMDLSHYADFEISFKFSLDMYFEAQVNFGIAVSTDGVNWSPLWTMISSTDIAASNHSLVIQDSDLQYETTRIALFFNGNTNYINGLYFDDVVLTADNKEVYGTWGANSTHIIEDIDHVVPDGETLTIEEGASVLFDLPAKFIVNGSLICNGTEENQIIFGRSPDYGSTGRIELRTDDNPVVFNHCFFDDLSAGSMYMGSNEMGGAVYAYEANDVTFTNCVFDDNYASNNGGALYFYVSGAIIQDCIFTNNTSYTSGGAIYAYNTDLDISHTLFWGNDAWNAAVAYMYGNCNLDMDYVTIANNSDDHGRDFLLYGFSSTPLGFTFSNSVVYNSEDAFYELYSNSHLDASLLNSVIEGLGNLPGAGEGGVISIDNCIDADPLFGEDYLPTWANFPIEDATKSPLIDAADPTMYDLDGTIADIGYAFYNQSKPNIIHVDDVPYDQGRLVQVMWGSGLEDNQYEFDAFYSVWRLDESTRNNNFQSHTNPELVISEAERTNEPVYWRIDGQYWAYLAAVPALMNDVYIYNAPTLRDSSSTGTHDVAFKVIHHRMSGYWQSNIVSGHSVDNIAPDLPAQFTLNRSGNNLQLAWSEVTTGTFENNTYDEINGIWYKIYASDSPEFDCNEQTYLMTTQNTSEIVGQTSANRMFYKIVVSDQP